MALRLLRVYIVHRLNGGTDDGVETLYFNNRCKSTSWPSTATETANKCNYIFIRILSAFLPFSEILIGVL